MQDRIRQADISIAVQQEFRDLEVAETRREHQGRNPILCGRQQVR